MENIQPGVSPCPTFTLQNCCSKSFANFIFQAGAAVVKNCVVLLVRCPRNCHLIIACPFTCQPHVPNTSACKNPMISCPLCTSSPSWDIYRQNTIFCSKIWSRARFQDTRRRICRTVNLFTTYPIYSTSVNLFAAFSRVLL